MNLFNFNDNPGLILFNTSTGTFSEKNLLEPACQVVREERGEVVGRLSVPISTVGNKRAAHCHGWPGKMRHKLLAGDIFGR